MKRYILIITIGFLLPAFMNAQSIGKAQKLMDKYNYAGAIEILKKTTPQEKNYNTALPMLAECYRLQHDVLNAKSTYAQVVTLPEAKPEAFYYYAQALQSTGNYSKAREMYQLYSEKNPSDPRGLIYVAHCDSVLDSWKDKKSDFEVKSAGSINTTQSDFGPAFYNDELVFASDYKSNNSEGKKYGWTGRGYLNIMKSHPLKTNDFYGEMASTTEFGSNFNQKYHDGPAAFSADGNSIYFTRSSYGKAKREGIYKTNVLKIYYADKINGNWSEVKPFFLNNTEFSVGHPALSADGQILYFVSNMPGGQGGTDIWMCNRENNEWGKPINLGKTVNTSENEMFPSTGINGVLFFASDGHPGYGALDVFKTQNINGSWSVPENLYPPVNGSFDDFAIAFAPNTNGGFFSSNRPGGLGSDDIYAFRKAEPVLPAFISGLVKDKTTMKPIEGATVFLYNTTNGNVKILKTNADGMYKTSITKPEDYIVKAMMPDFIADCTPFPAISILPATTSLAPRDLLLDKLVINKTFRIDNIYYNFDKYNIRKDAKPELDKLVNIMNENPINIELGSHTDCRGSFEYNDKLSERRAKSVVSYIISSGIAESRVTAKGYGERQLTNKCADGVNCTPEEHQANRRTEFKVVSFTTPSANPDQFNPGIYYDGQELYSKMLPADFFNGCK